MLGVRNLNDANNASADELRIAEEMSQPAVNYVYHVVFYYNFFNNGVSLGAIGPRRAIINFPDEITDEIAISSVEQELRGKNGFNRKGVSGSLTVTDWKLLKKEVWD